MSSPTRWLLYPITYPVSELCINVGAVFGMLKLHKRADNFFNIALKLTPDYGKAYRAKAVSRRMLEDYTQAVYFYTQAETRRQREPRLYYFRAICYTELKEYYLAIEDYNTALRLKPSLAYDVFVGRGLAYLGLRLYQNSLADFAQAQQLKPTKTDVYVNQSVALLKMRNYWQAIVACNAALERSSRLALAFNNRGVAYLWLNDYLQAEADYQQALLCDPKMAIAYTNLADLSLKTKNYQAAFSYCEEALSLDPKLLSAYINKALAHLFVLQSAQALAVLEQAQQLQPDDLEVKGLVLWLSLGTQRPGMDAISYIEHLVSTNPSDYYAQTLMAIATGLRGNWAASLAHLRVIWTLENEDLFNYFWRGLAAAFAMEDQEALPALRYAVSLTVPPPLLNPLHWLRLERPEFYRQEILPLIGERNP